MLITVTLTSVCLGLLIAEAVMVARMRGSIPIRIHVTGTRGKSSVALYIAAALRAQGRRTLCKVTGVVPTIVHPDGTQKEILRRGRARIHEQVVVLRLASRLQCNAVVAECMSISPLLQRLETQIFRPTLSVLTNILDDHREELGAAEDQRVSAFCSALPHGSTVLSNEQRHAAAIEKAAAGFGSSVTYAGPEGGPDVPDGIMPENIALALAACRLLGLEKGLSREAILREAGSLGDVPAARQLWTHKGLHFLNGFAVNDVPSADRYLSYWKDRLGPWSHLAVILNLRSDRPLRSAEFIRWCAQLSDHPDIFLVGTHKRWARRSLAQRGVPPERITVWTSEEARSAGSELATRGFPPGTVIVGMGNIGGDGFRVLESIRPWS